MKLSIVDIFLIPTTIHSDKQIIWGMIFIIGMIIISFYSTFKFGFWITLYDIIIPFLIILIMFIYYSILKFVSEGIETIN